MSRKGGNSSESDTEPGTERHRTDRHREAVAALVQQRAARVRAYRADVVVEAREQELRRRGASARRPQGKDHAQDTRIQVLHG